MEKLALEEKENATSKPLDEINPMENIEKDKEN